MKKLIRLSLLVGIIVVSSGFYGSEKASEKACWGQASKVFAQMGAMGEHSSSFDTPREGLRNLARSLYAAGILPDDSMQSLGAFVADELDIDISSCQ